MTGGSGDAVGSRAWNHYKRTGVVLPGHQGEIARRLAAEYAD